MKVKKITRRIFRRFSRRVTDIGGATVGAHFGATGAQCLDSYLYILNTRSFNEKVE